MSFTDKYSSANPKRKSRPTIQYMVDFTLPDHLSNDFIGTIPQQRNVVSRLFSEGKLLNYALSLENSKLWAIFSAESEADLMEMISDLPLSRYMKVRISELTFYNAVQAMPPAFSVN
ncbi:MAG: muconolactone Delta-isomerase family protein [Saprospiraceae bacterium]